MGHRFISMAEVIELALGTEGQKKPLSGAAVLRGGSRAFKTSHLRFDDLKRQSVTSRLEAACHFQLLLKIHLWILRLRISKPPLISLRERFTHLGGILAKPIEVSLVVVVLSDPRTLCDVQSITTIQVQIL